MFCLFELRRMPADSQYQSLPLGGVSIIATPGAPFYDDKSDEALFSAIRNGLKDSGVTLVEDERDINDKEFALDAAKRLVSLMGL